MAGGISIPFFPHSVYIIFIFGHVASLDAFNEAGGEDASAIGAAVAAGQSDHLPAPQLDRANQRADQRRQSLVTPR